ncbi:hypothetical protein BH11PLA2_BH11PLA2_07940 [soil metagenome]
MFELSHFAQMLVNLLAVGGGFLAGYLLTMLIAKFIDRAVIHRQSPKGLHKVVRILGGLAVAILVALIVFGHGQGWNLFGGAANGSGASDGKDAVQPISTPYTKPETPPEQVKPLPLSTERIRITLLGGGDVKEKKFYRIDDETVPVNLADVKAAIQKRMNVLATKPMLEVVFAKQNRLPQEHAAVTQLVQWVQDTARLTVTFPPDAP